MIAINPLLLLTLSELLLVLIAISVGFVIAGFFRKRNERRAIAKLIRRIKEDESRRRDETRSLMQKNFGIEGEALDAVVNEISREEKRFYQALINLFVRRDVQLLEVLNAECEGVTRPYRSIEIPKADSGWEEKELELNSEIAVLKEENERLTTELSITMDTMGTMLNEYASMYSGGAVSPEDKKKLAESNQTAGEERQEEKSASHGATDKLPSQESYPEVGVSDNSDTWIQQPQQIGEQAVGQQASGNLFNEVIDIDLDAGLSAHDETIVISNADEEARKNDETLVLDISGDGLIELDEEPESERVGT
ncbi:MAG: hypothetical protein KDI83_10170 [Gammaproteobacteria bacterium]|nr:hypothetical protein [Gammaproteobacteria bacterium]